MLWDQARAAHMDIALDIKSTACRLTPGPSEKRLIIERGIVFTGLSWAKMVKEVQPSFAVRHEQAANRDIKICAPACFPPNQHHIIDSEDTAPAPSQTECQELGFRQQVHPGCQPPGQARSVLLIRWSPFHLNQALYHQCIFFILELN